MPEIPCFDGDPFNLCSTREEVTFRIHNVGSVGLLAPHPGPLWDDSTLWRVSRLPLAPLRLDRWSTDVVAEYNPCDGTICWQFDDGHGYAFFETPHIPLRMIREQLRLVQTAC